ncbi:hypothetical protein AOQ84DRAFT_385004, partial [Glonium stellatum]
MPQHNIEQSPDAPPPGQPGLIVESTSDDECTLARKQHPCDTIIEHAPLVVADIKPCLTREQHNILETHFQRQHKPSSATKKSFATSLEVPVDKANNWFQNRRAKVKQDIKKQFLQFNTRTANIGIIESQPPTGHSEFPRAVQDVMSKASGVA